MEASELLEELIKCKIALAEKNNVLVLKGKEVSENIDRLNHLERLEEFMEQEEENLMTSIMMLVDEKNFLRSKIEEVLGVQYIQSEESLVTQEEEVLDSSLFFDFIPVLNPSSAWKCVIQNPSLKNTKGIQILAERGIPDELRGEVWFVMVQNKLFITENLYEKLVERAKTQSLEAKEQNGLNLIENDTKRTVNHEQLKGTAIQEDLGEILEVFGEYRMDIGYVQGMAYPVALLLLHMDKFRAFQTFANLVCSSKLLYAFYSFDLPVVKCYYRVFETLMLEYVPFVHIRFADLGISPDIYLLEWVNTLFAKNLGSEVVR